MKPLLKKKVVWLTGLSGSGKTTIATLLKNSLDEQQIPCYILDGDEIRKNLNKDLGFTTEDRSENIRRIAHVAKILFDAGLFVIVSAISPIAKDRQKAKNLFQKENFLEIFLDCPIEICEKRDVKGFYKKARSGTIQEFTGISSIYEKPQNPDLTIDTSKSSPTDFVQTILSKLNL